MISKRKRTTVNNMQENVKNHSRHELSNRELPESYRRLLSLIFYSPDPLIHKVQSHDKISS
jgi:hypothetical protein